MSRPALIISIIQRELEKGRPVFYGLYRDGGVKLLQIEEAHYRDAFDAKVPDIGGKTYTAINTYGVGYYSWQNRGIGIGHGSASIPVMDDDDNWEADRFQLFDDQPKLLVVARPPVMQQIEKTYEGR